MGTRKTISILGAAAALTAGGVAFAQPPRLIPPVDQNGLGVNPSTTMSFPGDSAQGWILRPEQPAYELRIEGRLEQTEPDELLVDRGAAAPDATVSVTPETSYYLDGEPVEYAELPPGSDVLVVFDLQGDERVAQRIEASSPGSPVPPGETLEDTAPPIAAELPGEAAEPGIPEAQLPPTTIELPTYPEMPPDTP